MPQVIYNQLWLYHNIIKPSIGLAYDMEKNGISINLQAREDVEVTLTKQIIEVEKKIWEIAGEEFQVGSNQQLVKILFHKLDLHVISRSKKMFDPYVPDKQVGLPIVNEQTIRALFADDRWTHPILPYIIEYRNLRKLLDTYVNKINNFIREDGRAHYNIFITGTETGRWTVKDPPMQTIPKREDTSGPIKKQGMIVRKLFYPRQGYIFVEIDFKQAELRILGYYSQSKELLKAARENIDLHSVVASAIFGVPLDEILAKKGTDKHIKFLRTVAKNIGFGWVYLGTCEGMQKRIPLLATIKLQMLKEGQINYFNRLDGVREFQHKIIFDLINKGEITNCYGRIRHIPKATTVKDWSSSLINSIIDGTFYETTRDPLKREEYGRIRDLFKEGLNSQIQGTSHDFVTLSLLAIWEWMKKEGFPAYILLDNHDAGLFEVREDLVPEFLGNAKRLAESQKGNMNVPMEIEAETGHNWFEMKEYKF